MFLRSESIKDVVNNNCARHTPLVVGKAFRSWFGGRWRTKTGFKVALKVLERSFLVGVRLAKEFQFTEAALRTAEMEAGDPPIQWTA